MSRLLLNRQNSAYGLLSASLRMGDSSWSASQVLFLVLVSQEHQGKVLFSSGQVSHAISSGVWKLAIFVLPWSGTLMTSCKSLPLPVPDSSLAAQRGCTKSGSWQMVSHRVLGSSLTGFSCSQEGGEMEKMGRWAYYPYWDENHFAFIFVDIVSISIKVSFEERVLLLKRWIPIQPLLYTSFQISGCHVTSFVLLSVNEQKVLRTLVYSKYRANVHCYHYWWQIEIRIE